MTPNDFETKNFKQVIRFVKEYKRQHNSFERPRLGKYLLCCTRDSGHVIQLPKNINWINIQFSLLINRLNSNNFILDFHLKMAIFILKWQVEAKNKKNLGIHPSDWTLSIL